MFPELIMPNQTLIKTGIRNLWNNSLKPKLEEYILTEASDSDITSTLDIWSDSTNQSFLGITIHFLIHYNIISYLIITYSYLLIHSIL